MLRVRILGELELDLDGASLAPPASRRARAVLGWLALHAGAQPRPALAGRLWPDVLDESARASLRSALWALRAALGPGAGALRATRDVLELGGDDVWVDARAFDELTGEGRMEAAVALCRGELLADLDDDWVLEARDVHRARVVEALGSLADLSAERGDHIAAVGWRRRQLAADPLHEEACRGLMIALAHTGDRSGALAAYAKLRERLHRQVGIAPSAATRAVAEDLRTGEQPAPAAVPPAARPVRRDDGTPPLAGRDAELAELLAAWRRSRAGRGCAVVVEGEAGVGKSRLCEELVERARADGARTATAVAAGLGSASALAVWAELLRGLTRDLPADAETPRALADLEPLAPQLVTRRAAGDAAFLPPELARTRLFEAVVALAEWLTTDRPLVLVLDDVHLADGPSLELCAHLARRAADLPVLLVLARRDLPARGEVDVLVQRLRAGDRLAAQISLGRLEPAAVRRLAADAGAAPGQVEAVVAAAGGSPLLAVEAARALAAGRASPATELRGLVRASFADLTPQAKAVADYLAVAGRGLERGELAALPIGQLLPACTAAIESGVLVATGGRIDYRHALLREAAYEELAEHRREALHEQLAVALGARHPLDGGRAGEVAAHLRWARRDDLAVRALRRAAEHARSVGALDEAAARLHEALDVAGGDAGAWLELADVEAWRGRVDEAEAAFATALEHGTGAGPAWHADAWMRRVQWYRSILCTPRLVVESIDRVLAALDAAGADDGDLRRRATACAAWAQAVAGDPGRAEALLAEAEAAGGADGDDLLRCELATARGTTLVRRQRFPEACAELADGAAAAQRARRPDLAYACWDGACCAAGCAGDDEGSLRYLDRGLAGVRGTGLLAIEARFHAQRARVLTRLERLDEADAAARAAQAAAALAEDGGVVAQADHERGLVALARGDHAAAERLLGDALDHALDVDRPLAHIARAEALVRLGRPAEAGEAVRAAALEPVGAGVFAQTLVPRLTRVQGLIAAATGDHGLAVRRLEEAERGWAPLAKRAAGDRYAAVLAELGRGPLGLVEPRREMARVRSERHALEREGAIAG